MPTAGDSQVTDTNGNGRALGLLRPHASQLFLVLFLLGLLAITNMALPFAIKLLIDDVFKGNAADGTMSAAWKLLAAILISLVLIYVIRNSLFFSSRMLALRTGENVCFSLRKRLFEHLQQLSLRFYRSNQPGIIGARVMDDTFKIQSFIQDKFPLLLLNLLMFQILIVILCLVNVRLAAASVVILPLQFITYRFFRLSIKQSHSEAQENLSLAYGNLVEKFLGIEVVKGFSAEARESATFNKAIDASRESQIKSQRFHFAQKVVSDLLVGAGTILLLGYGAFEVLKGHMESGEFIMFFWYVGMLYPSVLEIISGVGHFSKATASVDRVFEMLDEPIHEAGVATENTSSDSTIIDNGVIEFKNVHFGFDDTAPVLHDLNLTINPGERIAITGPSGSGKSTTINLLPRFISPTAGCITINEQDIAKLPVAALRAAIGIAFQEVFLFNASIFENLRYARSDATLDDVREVCEITGADEVIKRLPNGYDTRLAEFGAELSRGEKQRITLARALLKDSQVLLLDESTASIDRESSRAIMNAIFQRMENRTIIVVTHEAYLLDLVDRVISIRDGRICFDGSPREYMRIEPNAFLPSPIPPGEQAIESIHTRNDTIISLPTAQPHTQSSPTVSVRPVTPNPPD